MALYPRDYTTQEVMQPGYNGQKFVADLPGYRNGAERINRSNHRLNVSEHDVPNIKYQFDHRLPSLFKYGFAYGFNQIVIPKGRIVAVDPHMDLVDFESNKKFSTLTLANGGVPVRLRKEADMYPTLTKDGKSIISDLGMGAKTGLEKKEWIPMEGLDKTYKDKYFRPFAPGGAFKTAADQLGAGNLVDEKTGLIRKAGGAMPDEGEIRPGNVPIGINERNEYTRDNDAYNGMMPGPVLTDALVELPWFAYKDKAEGNPWGSAYGALFPGCLVRSDENGRFVPSILSFPKEMADMTIQEYEAERQQVIGQVYSVNTELVPEGAAKWATWALEDRMNSEVFNPAVYAKTNRRGEDAVSNSPYYSNGEYPGYPYDKNYLNHDLHMLASTGRGDNYDPRMNPEYRYSDLGIPGLTDGGNVAIKEVGPENAGFINYAGEENGQQKEYVDMYFRTMEVNIEPNTLELSITGASGSDSFKPCVVTPDDEFINTCFKVRYVSEKQGIVVIGVDATKLNEAKTLLEKGAATVKFKYKKRGLAGVPTFMDWDGAVGSVKILLTK